MCLVADSMMIAPISIQPRCIETHATTCSSSLKVKDKAHETAKFRELLMLSPLTTSGAHRTTAATSAKPIAPTTPVVNSRKPSTVASPSSTKRNLHSRLHGERIRCKYLQFLGISRTIEKTNTNSITKRNTRDLSVLSTQNIFIVSARPDEDKGNTSACSDDSASTTTTSSTSSSTCPCSSRSSSFSSAADSTPSSTFPATCVTTSSSSSSSSCTKKTVRFQDQIPASHIHYIPSRHLYSARHKQTIWISPEELRQAYARNVLEYQYEGWDCRNVLEEDQFVHVQGQWIHPAHVESQLQLQLQYSYPPQKQYCYSPSSSQDQQQPQHQAPLQQPQQDSPYPYSSPPPPRKPSAGPGGHHNLKQHFCRVMSAQQRR